MKKTSAEVASQEALTSLFECIKNKQHFRLEAGAGAGKTYSLIKVLEELIKENKELYLKQGKKIACITYTNVAKDEIIARTDRNPIVFCETNHAFCWSLINPFQKALREQIPQLQNWKDKLEKESEDIQNKQIVYKLGYRSIKNGELSLHHDDIIDLTIKLLEEPKFRQILIEKFPIILIDEYQDTDKKWINAVKTHFLDRPASPLFGFFGDHWQKIYGDGCGLIKHSKIEEINKNANFRSSKVIVEALNEMRKELPQCISDESSDGHIHIFHTNNWEVTRQTSQHWKGDLEKEDAHKAIDKVKEYLKDQGWDFSLNKTKILMLTHKLLANAQGYSGIANAFKHNESFIKKENKYIAFFIDQLEPIVEA
ncbi:TPA: ATP-dependent helicase, partial [Pasteurella multocida]|nr:ATP-dependent helicase [Pasteurella multocida]